MGETIMRKITDIADLINGYAFKSQNYVDSGIRVIRIANVQDGYITDEQPCFYSTKTTEDIKKYILQEGDLLVSLTGNVGRVGILKAEMLPAALNQRVSCIRLKNSTVNKKYLYYYLRRKEFIRDCTKASKGVAQLNLSTKWLEQYQIPVPSLPEQERIVTRIEELFSQLDNGLETLQTIKKQLTVYRQAILKEAFKGNYKHCSLGEISQTISGYAFKSNQYTPNGNYVVVKIGNVKQWEFDFSRDLTRTNEANDSIIKKYLLKRGDCLITLTGSRGKRDYGFVAMIESQTNYFLNQRVAALRFDPAIALPEFYKYYLASPDYRNQFFHYETGNVGQGNVGVKALCEPSVICPSLVEQAHIVEEIESRLSVCDSIEQTVDTVLQQSEAMWQSILRKAFVGEL